MKIQEKDVGIQLMCSIEEVKEIYRALFQNAALIARRTF